MKKVNLLSKVLACGLVTVLLTSCGSADTNNGGSQAASNVSTTTETVQAGSEDATSSESASTDLSASSEDNENAASESSSTSDENSSSDASSTTSTTEPPVDGDRVVLAGTVQKLSYADLLALQREKEPGKYTEDVYNAMFDGQEYTVLILDEMQELEAMAPGYDSYTVKTYLIDISGATGAENYIGKKVYISITPENTNYPSDVSAPFEQPRTNDVNFIE